ncbi:hypothetical protein [Streptomyces sp. RKAG290]|uniref:tetratricopeptide repeat protein n=1 Tax=Streptomyces sp. RKAG290 TaxID=2888348 RepID=UPI0020335F5B|nr:hypothetical protein [Streptomyces sp. RKAG290]MCM2413432.1 hypothetical protein [Streptomyces sp. RKAG290]
MQGTDHEHTLEGAKAAAHAALQAARPADARARATAALEEFGPDPALHTLLGRAHARENDDDHDDEAERAYRQGLAAFPDDLDLLTAYAELCLESDALDRPGRHSRGPGLADRVSALAPGSPQALHLDRVRMGTGGRPSLAGPIPRSGARMQRHDVRTSLASAPSTAEAVRLAEEDAQRYPYDLRRVIRAETLTALGRPRRRLLRAHVRTPILSVLVAAALATVALIPRTASPVSVWAAAAALLTIVPHLVVGALESRACIRALARLLPPPAPGDSDPTYSMLPPPPAPGVRDFAVLWTAVTLAVFALVSPLALMDHVRAAPPHHTASAPATFLGEPLLSARPAMDGVDADLAAVWMPSRAGSFSYAYGTVEHLADNGGLPSTLVFGATGDFHDVPADTADSYERGLAESDSVIDATWDGPTGAPVHCVSYASGDEEPGAHVACSWSAGDSFGTVVMDGAGLSHDYAVVRTMMAWTEIVHQDGGEVEDGGETSVTARQPAASHLEVCLL